MNVFLKNFGDFLKDVKEKYRNLVVFNSLLRNELSLGTFFSSYEDSYFDFAHANNFMMKGLDSFVLRGKVPLVLGSASDFMYNNFGSIKNDVAYNNLNVKILSFFPAFDRANLGHDQMVFDDIMLMRSIPNMKVFVPSHIMELKKMLQMAMESFGPVYLRINEDLMEEGKLDEMGKVSILHEGNDILIFSMGSILREVLKLPKRFEDQFKTIRIVNVPVLKDLEDFDFSDFCEGFEHVFSIEEHSEFGGLGDFLRDSGVENLKKISISKSALLDCGQKADLRRKYKFDLEGLYNRLNDFIAE